MSSKLVATLGVCLCLMACSADSSGRSGPDRAGGGTTGANAGTSGNTAGISGGGQVTGGTNGGAGASGSNAADGGISGPVNIDQCGAMNTSGLSATDLKTLMAGNGQAGTMRYLYPYDGTIFPRGLISPTLMWDGADDAEAVYVHVKSSLFELKGCYKPSAPGQLQLPQDVWTMAEGATQGAADPFTVELNVIKGGAATGPIKETVIIAQATLKGSIFYNSYASKLSPGAGSVLRIVPGMNVDVFIKGNSFTDNCNGCHAMSANGERLVTDLVTGGMANVFKLDPMTAPMPPILHSNPAAGFVGITPTGDAYVTNAGKVQPTLRAGTTDTSILVATDTGTEIAGSGIPTTAVMPTFSSDGTHLVFNDNAIAAGHGIAEMDYDAVMHKATNYRMIYSNTASDHLPGWPFMLPDNHAVVFHLGAATDFSGGDVGITPLTNSLFPGFLGGGGMMGDPAPTVGPWGNLYLLDLDSGKPVMLAKAMGFATEADAAMGKSYLPFVTDELNMSYYPTVSPVAAGGYFWVFFDSERHYGNKGLHRQLWGTAVTISADGKYTTDPSHPPFFLTGQEEGTGNHRAFTALTPCKIEGDTCKTGIDCCGGFCEFPAGTNEFAANAVGMCKKPTEMRCSKIDETCKTSKDCCDKSASCIAGFCGLVIPQ